MTPSRRLKRGATATLIVTGLIAAALAIVPRALDRVYYRGPVSDHFDGAHFYNPDDGKPGTGAAPERRGFSPLRFARFAAGIDRAPWPDHVAVRQQVPPARVAGEAMRVTWIGHSTVLIQTQGLNILTDPIWAERASPFSFAGPKRVRAPGVAFERLPKIDAVLVSHNHYDHMDVATLKRLWRRDRPRIVVALGADTILREADIPAVARDWGDQVALAPGVAVKLERVHHWTSRWGADRNRALWTGFTIRLPRGGNIFFAGDTGMGDGSWVRDAARDGPYRLALIPIGAYLPREMMAQSHIGPAEAATIYRALGTHYGVAIHWGTFPLSSEALEDPPRQLARQGIQNFRTLEPGEGRDIPLEQKDGDTGVDAPAILSSRSGEDHP